MALASLSSGSTELFHKGEFFHKGKTGERHLSSGDVVGQGTDRRPWLLLRGERRARIGVDFADAASAFCGLCVLSRERRGRVGRDDEQEAAIRANERLRQGGEQPS